MNTTESRFRNGKDASFKNRGRLSDSFLFRLLAWSQKMTRNMVTFFSPHPSIFAIFVSLMCCKAEALWRWSNYLQSRNETGRPHVLINMDETNIKLVPQERGGHVSKGAYRLFVRGHPMGRIASLAAQRYSITHVAAICDRPDFQMLLPQVVIVGASQITEARLATLRSRAPACVRIWREPTAWMTADIMVRYILLLGRCL